MGKLSNIKILTTSAMLLAMAVIFGFLKVPITPTLEIRFTMIPIAVAGTLFGPVVGGIVGALSDIVAYLVKPTGPFFPGFTITAAIGGVIFGLMLHKKKITVVRMLIANALYSLIVGMILNTLMLAILYGYLGDMTKFMAMFIGRVPKELLMIPINTALILIIHRALKQVHVLDEFLSAKPQTPA
ncbi:MAG: folate family ECF transporter S component [Eubacteriales bacterium]|nr:folate family ECF transporter S component [Eubacteriales bacterium]